MDEIFEKSKKFFSNLYFAQFEFTIEPYEELFLPGFSGSTFRGAFGYALKSVACLKKKKCETCAHPDICAYGYMFETPRPKNAEIMRKYEVIPHPFILTPPINSKKIFKNGEEINFEIVLFGKAVPFFPYVVYAFEEMGKRGLGKKRGKFKLLYVKQRVKKIYHEGVISTDYEIKKGEDFFKKEEKASKISLIFLTPVKIIYQGKIAKKLEFHIIFRNLLRRLALLTYFHIGKKPEIDFRKIIEISKNIKCIEQNLKEIKIFRYSARQKKKIPIEGIKGNVNYEGNLTPFLPYLRIGEYLHIGKNTSFGLGKYRIEIF